MTSSTSFWLIRHAVVLGPVGVIHPSNARADLGDRDRLASLAAQLPGQAISYCSPARRTRDTASALGLTPMIAPKLKEQDFGSWTGHRHDSLVRKRDVDYEKFWASPAANAPPGGESFEEQIARTEIAVDGMPIGDVVLVVHSGTIRAMLAIALMLDPARALSFVVDPLSLTRIDRLSGGWRIVSVNQTR